MIISQLSSYVQAQKLWSTLLMFRVQKQGSWQRPWPDRSLHVCFSFQRFDYTLPARLTTDQRPNKNRKTKSGENINSKHAYDHLEYSNYRNPFSFPLAVSVLSVSLSFCFPSFF